MTNQTPNISALTRGARPEVVSAIRQASAETGVDFAYLLEKAATESSFDPTAQASTSSARGLYQFVDRTWLDVMDKHAAEHGYPNIANAITRDSHGNPVLANDDAKQYILSLRENPRISALMAAEFSQENKQVLEQSLGREVGNAELYMAHFLGAGGASKFLSNMEQNPGIDAERIVPDAARANRGVFYEGGQALSLNEVFTRFAGRFGAVPDGPAALPTELVAAQVTDAQTDTATATIAAFDPAFAALRATQEYPERAGTGSLRADLVTQMFTLSLLQAFDASDERGNKSNEWVV